MGGDAEAEWCDRGSGGWIAVDAPADRRSRGQAARAGCLNVCHLIKRDLRLMLGISMSSLCIMHVIIFTTRYVVTVQEYPR